MMLDIVHLMLLTVAIGLGVYLWRAPSVYELALRTGRQYCHNLELQFLDDSVSLSRIWVKRNRSGQLRLWRAYQFEFTVSGGERYRGAIITLGYAVENIQMPPHIINPPSTLH